MVSFGELCSALSRVGYCNTQADADADALVYVKVCTVRARCVWGAGAGGGRWEGRAGCKCSYYWNPKRVNDVNHKI